MTERVVNKSGRLGGYHLNFKWQYFSSAMRGNGSEHWWTLRSNWNLCFHVMSADIYITPTTNDNLMFTFTFTLWPGLSEHVLIPTFAIYSMSLTFTLDEPRTTIYNDLTLWSGLFDRETSRQLLPYHILQHLHYTTSTQKDILISIFTFLCGLIVRVVESHQHMLIFHNL